MCHSNSFLSGLILWQIKFPLEGRRHSSFTSATPATGILSGNIHSMELNLTCKLGHSIDVLFDLNGELSSGSQNQSKQRTLQWCNAATQFLF